MEFKACLLLLLKIGLYSHVLIRQCSNGCPSTDFQCPDGQCIPESYVCDDVDDCPDSSDETETTCPSPKCHGNQFPCANGSCIFYEQRCDGIDNCRDYSDEKCDPYLDNFLIVAEVNSSRGGGPGGLYQIHLRNGTMVPLGIRSTKINGVAFDGITRTVYWTDVDSATIRRHTLTNDGRKNRAIETIYTAPPLGGKLEGLALDVDNDSLYYCQSSNSTSGSPGIIGKMSLNGENHRIVVTEATGNPRSIVLDKVNRLMYWTDWGENPVILRASMEDGGNKTVLVNSGIVHPNALAIDFAEDVLYWGDAGSHRIESISLSGTRNRRVILDESSTNASYFSFALSSNYLYITDKSQRSVRKFNLRTAKISNQYPAGLFDWLYGIVYYHSTTIQKASSRRSPKTLPTTTFRTTRPPVGIRRTKTTSVTTTDMLSTGQAATVEGTLGLDSGKQKQSIADPSVTAVIAVIVVGVILMTCVITTGIFIIRAKRRRNHLPIDKRPVPLPPPPQRDVNSYDYIPVSTQSEGRGGGRGRRGGEGGRGSAEAGGRGDDDGETSSTSAFFRPRGPAVRTSSGQPFLDEDSLALNNIYSTIAGDYENVNPYEIIDDD